jgi:hypothetical protein
MDQTAGTAKCRYPSHGYHTFAHQAADSGLKDRVFDKGVSELYSLYPGGYHFRLDHIQVYNDGCDLPLQMTSLLTGQSRYFHQWKTLMDLTDGGMVLTDGWMVLTVGRNYFHRLLKRF